MRELRFEKVCFRRVEQSDLLQRVEWLNDPAVQRTLSYDWPVTLEKTEAWFQRHRGSETRTDFSILTTDGRYIGFCGLLGIDQDVGKAEHYITIGDSEFRGRGYGRDSYILLQIYTFEVLELNRLYGYQLVNNEAGHRLVEKLGWTREGLLRQDKLSHGEVVDRYVISMLRDEWLTKKKAYV